MRCLTAIVMLLLLIACSQTSVVRIEAIDPAVPASADELRGAAIEEDQSIIAEHIAPAISAVRDGIQSVLPKAEATLGGAQLISPAAAAHIVRWEVSSPDYYTRRLQVPIWPGGASGITWGIGYDGGHQSAAAIRSDWAEHPDVDRLANAAGVTGTAARAALPGYRGIVTPYALAERVFVDVSLPVYHRSTVRAYGDGLLALPEDAVGALVGNTYNRGPSMVGTRNAEKRHIRDVCIPGQDLDCIAQQLRNQCRLWRNTELEDGLCGRRESEAELVEAAR